MAGRSLYIRGRITVSDNYDSDCTVFGGNTLLLRSSTGSGHGIPTAAHAVMIARYQPLISPRNPKPPAMCSNFAMCSRSASVVADATLKSAAAMKANSITRPKNVNVKNKLTRMVPMRKTKLAITLDRD
jgi:hypothetical protein